MYILGDTITEISTIKIFNKNILINLLKNFVNAN